MPRASKRPGVKSHTSRSKRPRARAQPPRQALVFISHDSRDAVLADAFAQLLKRASSGMIGYFHSSDKSPGGGVDYSAEWFQSLMEKLRQATEVVCLLTPRSVERPWILFEAGVAKGMRSAPVHGLKLGLAQAVSGPFAQYQLCDGSKVELVKLVRQLCRRVEGLEPPAADLESHVEAFCKQVEAAQKAFGALAGGQRWKRRIPICPDADKCQQIGSLLDRVRDEVSQFLALRRKPVPSDCIRANVLLPDPVADDETQFPGQLIFVATRPEGSYGKLELSNRFAPGEGVSGKVFLNGAAYAQDGRIGVAKLKLEAMDARLSGVAGFPLLDPVDKTAFGVVCVDLLDADPVSDDDLRKLCDYRPVRDLVGTIAKLLNPRDNESFVLEYLARS
jgi:hypothetical protein